MKTVYELVRRNVKNFFKDKAMFITSLITPVILLVLYVIFLGDVYRDSFLSSLPAGIELPDRLVSGLVGGQLVSSILAVSCITVSFCSGFLSVQDKALGSVKDFAISPVKPWQMSLGYYISNLFSSLIICTFATLIGFVYLWIVGWYISFADLLLFILDVILLTVFGTVLATFINCFLSTQAQISAVGTIVSSGYGFISGAYMPISSFADGLQKVISLLPGTYGTSLLRNHALRGVISELKEEGIPKEAIDGICDLLDCNVYAFGEKVAEPFMYLILLGATVVFATAYLLINRRRKI